MTAHNRGYGVRCPVICLVPAPVRPIRIAAPVPAPPSNRSTVVDGDRGRASCCCCIGKINRVVDCHAVIAGRLDDRSITADRDITYHVIKKIGISIAAVNYSSAVGSSRADCSAGDCDSAVASA